MTFRKILAALVLSTALLAPAVVPATAQASTITGYTPAASVGTVEVLHYAPNVMRRVYENHQNPRFARTGDYVPTLRNRYGGPNGRDANCLTAVNYRSRWMLRHSIVLVVELWDVKQQRWEKFNCAAADWQKPKDSTGARQRLEVDWYTARAVNMTGNGTTRARIIGYR